MGGYKYIGGRYAHRVIYEQEVGPIPRGGIIHHKDGDRSNNAVDNLEAMSVGDHMRLHAAGRVNSTAQRTAAAATLASLRTPKHCSCAHCGEGFVSLAAGKPSRFCSVGCLEQWRRNKFVPEQRTCLVCGAGYTAVKRFQRYCSKACNNRSKVRTYRAEANGGKQRRKVAELTDL